MKLKTTIKNSLAALVNRGVEFFPDPRQRKTRQVQNTTLIISIVIILLTLLQHMTNMLIGYYLARQGHVNLSVWIDITIYYSTIMVFPLVVALATFYRHKTSDSKDRVFFFHALVTGAYVVLMVLSLEKEMYIFLVVIAGASLARIIYNRLSLTVLSLVVVAIFTPLCVEFLYRHGALFPVKQAFIGESLWYDVIVISTRSIVIISVFLLVGTMAIYNAKVVEEAEDKFNLEREKSDRLLLNILPEKVADELKETGAARPVLVESATVFFTDFVGFTKISEKLTPAELVSELDLCFSHFDRITEKYGIEKLKTIGDGFMAAGGIPQANQTHAVDACLAALDIQMFMSQTKQEKETRGLPYWELRLGVHTGPLVAGVVGAKKFAYDVWGDTVNTAARMESSGAPGAINISSTTYEAVQHLFDCEYRGKIEAKNKGMIDMYFLHAIKPEFSVDGNGRAPNAGFHEIYKDLEIAN